MTCFSSSTCSGVGLPFSFWRPRSSSTCGTSSRQRASASSSSSNASAPPFRAMRPAPTPGRCAQRGGRSILDEERDEIVQFFVAELVVRLHDAFGVALFDVRVRVRDRRPNELRQAAGSRSQRGPGARRGPARWCRSRPPGRRYGSRCSRSMRRAALRRPDRPRQRPRRYRSRSRRSRSRRCPFRRCQSASVVPSTVSGVAVVSSPPPQPTSSAAKSAIRRNDARGRIYPGNQSH